VLYFWSNCLLGRFYAPHWTTKTITATDFHWHFNRLGVIRLWRHYCKYRPESEQLMLGFTQYYKSRLGPVVWRPAATVYDKLSPRVCFNYESDYFVSELYRAGACPGLLLWLLGAKTGNFQPATWRLADSIHTLSQNELVHLGEKKEYLCTMLNWIFRNI
jgi:hypothetical protein